MSKTLKIPLCLVLVASLTLIALCTLNYLSLGRELSSCRLQLAESREKWKGIAAEKEALQEDLKAVQKKLNIANLELEKSTADAEEIKTEIEQLRKEIDELNQNRSTE